MCYYRLYVPAYFSTRLNMQREPNTIHVVGEAARDKHITQITNQGGHGIVVTELTAAEYRASAMARFS